MFKNVKSPKNDEMFRFAMTITIFLFMVVTFAFSYELSSLI